MFSNLMLSGSQVRILSASQYECVKNHFIFALAVLWWNEFQLSFLGGAGAPSIWRAFSAGTCLVPAAEHHIQNIRKNSQTRLIF